MLLPPRPVQLQADGSSGRLSAGQAPSCPVIGRPGRLKVH